MNYLLFNPLANKLMYRFVRGELESLGFDAAKIRQERNSLHLQYIYAIWYIL